MSKTPKPASGVQAMLDAAMDAEASKQRLAKRAHDAVDPPEALSALSRAAKGGGKLSRSETVTVRLDPKLRYLAELAARLHRRTLSSYIEWAIKASLDTEAVRPTNIPGTVAGDQTIGNEAEYLWDVDEADRFAKLALRYPHLLTHDEQVRWKLIRECVMLWRNGFPDDGNRVLNFEMLRRNWGVVTEAAAAGKAGYELDFLVE